VSDAVISLKRSYSWLAYFVNLSHPASHITVLDEHDYFIPVQIALEFYRQGQYELALDWFRTVYKYDEPVDQRKIAFKLTAEESLTVVISRPDDWLSDPLNPHLIAEKRRNAYTRYTILSIKQCLLDYADEKFTLDTSESIAEARLLYQMVLDLCDVDELKQSDEGCDDLIGNLDIKIGDGYWVLNDVLARLRSGRVGPRLHLRCALSPLLGHRSGKYQYSNPSSLDRRPAQWFQLG